MARKKRNFMAQCYYHIYNRGNNKNIVFRQSEDKEIFIKNLYAYSRRFDIEIISYCIMQNHYHLIIKTGARPQDVSILMHDFTTKFCTYLNKKYNNVGHVFQGRYKAKFIKSESNLLRVKLYLKKNPEKAGYVKNYEDYKWMK